ncbi:superfamily I DNA/RNA helicase [Spiroplasma gladiatoris]|uniref:Superfamily I DNA/RNA helicase n=1 Tax=Spiroplasma gladiatoris TaxID=2143 RepID=A0A4P7AI59_9MOLU|nr:AAA domain-containing protein [Spiroplasma gladiatoris]QBQ07373.1 superfamily I DNA/RNA helicase [Spiroplasma gladiatoris]
MANVIENDGTKEIFLDFSYLQNVMFKDNVLELDNIISKLDIENINSYQELQLFLRNSMIKQAFICLIDDKTRKINKKDKNSIVYDAIIRVELNTTSQSKMPKDTYLGFFVNIDPQKPYLTIASIFQTRLKPIAQEFESLVQESRIQIIKYQGQITPEEVLRRNVFNSSNIASIGKLVSKFEEEKNKWLNYLEFSYDLLQSQRKFSLPYLNSKIIKVIKIERNNFYNDSIKKVKILLTNYNNFFVDFKYLDLVKDLNIEFETSNLIILDVLFNNYKVLESLKKLKELSIVPLNTNVNLPALYDLTKNIAEIFDFSFDKILDNSKMINLNNLILEKEDKVTLIDYWKEKKEILFGGEVELKELAKENEDFLNQLQVTQLVYEIDQEINTNLFSKNINYENLDSGYLAYVGFGDDVLIERGRQVLKRISEGNIKNPYLINYLFNTKLIDLSQENQNWEIKKEEYYYSLNYEQKEAVKKAINSKDVFLLQGPPGTGKTQVICEIIYQLTRQNRKILISSQNHEAIKNVVDRLPYEPNINRIRLTNQINVKSKTSNNFSPERCVYNYYKSLTKSMFDDMSFEQNQIEHLNEIENNLEKLIINNKGYHQNNNQLREIQNQIESINEEINFIKSKEIENIHKKNEVKEELLNIENLISVLSDFNFNVAINISDSINKVFNHEIKFMFEEFVLNNIKENILETNLFLKIKKVCEAILFKDDVFVSIKESKQRILNLKRDAEFDLANKEEETLIGLEKLLLNNLVISNLIEILSTFRKSLLNLKTDLIYKLENLNQHESSEEILNTLEVKKNELYVNREKLIETTGNNSKEIRELIKYANNKFKLNLGLMDVDLEIQIKEQLNKLRKKLEISKQKNESLKDFYNMVSGYVSENYNIDNDWSKELSTQEFTRQMVQDSRRYTNSVLNNLINVYAMTLTSTNMFRFNKDENAKKLGLEEINLRTMDVDVVIIDEASKATLLEILMPLIYGKTLILVGDYRQLPPILKLKQSDVDLVNNMTNKNYNYQELFELLDKSAFKNLIAARNKSITTMLKTQYRSHRQIMEVVNKFYDNELRVEQQVSDQKKHDLIVNSTHCNEIINSKSSVYWVDSTYDINNEIYYEQGEEYSTSLFNELEVKITCQLIKDIDKSIKNKKISYKPSLAIISFYGLHVEKLKKSIKKINIKNIDLIISTVDDFQGKEADYVIVNMVRNPKRLSSQNGREFLKKYERINVAFSRAKELLLIIGAQRAVGDIVVQIPTVADPNISNTYEVYSDIIAKIYHEGGLLTTKDIL